MRKIQYILAALFLLQTNALKAQAQTISIKAPGFARPLVERWIAEYKKTNNELDFQLVQGKQDSDLGFVVSENKDEQAANGETVFFGRYAIVPFTAKESEAATLIAKKKLNHKRIKSLFFVKDELSDEQDDKLEGKLHIYTGNNSLSSARPFAASYGLTAADFKGKRISGDDRYLNQAVSRDPLGVSINALSNIYDLESRQVQPQVQLAALDADKKAGLEANASLDDVLQILETRAVDGIDIEKLGLSFDVNNPQANHFVSWVLTEGKNYLHQYGLLSLPEKELTAQLRSVQRQDFAQK